MNQAEEDESLYHALEEEAINVDCLLVEPRSDQVSVSGVWCFDEDNLGKYKKMENIPCGFGVPVSHARVEGLDTTKLNVLDGLRHEVGGESLLGEIGVPACDDYILDIGFVEHGAGVVHGSHEGLHVGNSSPESQIPGFSSSDKNKISSLSESGCQNNFLGKTTRNLRGKMNNNCVFGTAVLVNSSNFSTSFQSENVDKFEHDPSSFICNEKDRDSPPDHFASNGMSCSSRNLIHEGESVHQGVEMETLPGQDAPTNSIQDGSVGAVTHKRLRKPTKRYIDESSSLSLKKCMKRKEASSAPKVKVLGVQRSKHRHEMGSKAKVSSSKISHEMGSKAKVSSSEISFDKAIQVPFISQGPMEYPENHTSAVVENCGGNYSIGLEDESEMTMTRVGGNQRKLHRLWTVSEVKKLIDGVAHFGVGKWTHIKRLLFSSSVHRTPVDLKDKWRNLLKASGALKGSKIEDEQKRNQPWRPLPKSILCRVRELASVYPYPREGDLKKSKSKLQHVRHVSSPARIKGNRVPFL